MDYRDTLEEIELMGGLIGAREAAVRFMIGACRRMPLPEHLHGPLGVAARYLSGDASNEALEAARVSCWRSIEGQTSNLSETRVAATRAVICTLYPRDHEGDLFDTLEVFGDFARAAGLSVEALLEGLRRAFEVSTRASPRSTERR